MAPQRLGQHFLSSEAWRERILRLVLGADATDTAPGESSDAKPHLADLWLEIGAGHGEMTTLLAPRVARLIAIELDAELVPQLRQRIEGLSNVSIVQADVMALDIAALTESKPFHAYGNLPYYITSPIVHRLLSHADRLQAAFFVMQLEVAERMTARPGSRDYGYFSVFTQFYSQPQILLRIPPGAFQPPPKVSSALIALHIDTGWPHPEVAREDEARFIDFLKLCFAQKRKMLRNNLRALLPQNQLSGLLRECGIAANARAEELGLPDFARLFAEVQNLKLKAR